MNMREVARRKINKLKMIRGGTVMFSNRKRKN
jgi:hypothetical protein